MILECLSRINELTDWEMEFLSSCATDYLDGGLSTAKQEKLSEVYLERVFSGG